MKNCNCDTEIVVQGSSQLNRYLTALDPSYAPIDGRRIEDLLVFAKRYAAQIRFYDVPESKIDDPTPAAKVSWREFFRRDMAVIASSISTIDLQQIKKDYNEISAQLNLKPTPEIFGDLFKPIIGILKRIDRWYTVAIPQNPLRTDLDLAISSNLKSQVAKMLAYEEGFKYVDPKKKLTLDFTGIENPIVWGVDDPTDPDTSIYTGVTEHDKILSGALYVDDIFNSFFSFLSKLVANSDSYLQFALEQYPGHQPHMALFIAFLQLFQLAQQQMNDLTQRMLEFYYRDVLHLAEKPAVPDHAFVVFELAKDVAEYDISQGTKLSAGKDSGGKDQTYQVEADFVANRAKVKELKTVFIQKIADSNNPDIEIVESIFARPVANSQDGFGAAFTDPSGKWPTFGKGVPTTQKAQNICDRISTIKEEIGASPNTQIGFAIASPELLMQGGNRLVSVRISPTSTIDPTLEIFGPKSKPKAVSIWLSADKGWLKVNTRLNDGVLETIVKDGVFQPNLNTSYFLTTEKSFSVLSVVLPLAEKAILPYDPKVHVGQSFDTSLPLMLFMLGPDIKMDSNTFESLSAANIAINLQVGSINSSQQTTGTFVPTVHHNDGLKTLILQNDDGAIVAGKPFDPFTAYPFPGKRLLVGSNEIFNKPLSALAIDITNVVDNSSFMSQYGFYYHPSLLENKQWVALINGEDFTKDGLTLNILTGNEQLVRTPLIGADNYNQKSTKGFIALEYGYTTSVVGLKNKAELVQPKAENNFAIDFQDIASQAVYFKIKDISVSYYSILRILDSSTDQFFHVYPFGATETYLQANIQTRATIGKINELNGQLLPYSIAGSILHPTTTSSFQKLDAKKDYLLVDAKSKLLPQFTYQSVYTKPKSDGTLISIHNTVLVGEKGGYSKLEKMMLQASGISENLIGGNNQYSALEQEEGMLFIGLENALPLQTISLLLQFAEGSAQDEEDDPPPINWSYLTNNEWRPLKGEDLISDSTFGFQTTGILKLSLPVDATNNNTIITNGLYWFCASVTNYSNRVPYLINIVSQAVSAVFADNSNAPSHYDQPLTAGTISQLTVKAAQVSKVTQPFSSFDGKHREAGKEFYTRASERLRHKNRAITAWDYEHLVLNQFPSIYVVKCVTHTDPNCLCRNVVDVVIGTAGPTAKDFPFTYNSDGFMDDSTNMLSALADVKSHTGLALNITIVELNANEAPIVQRLLQQIKNAFIAEGIAAQSILSSTSIGNARTGNINLSGYPASTGSTLKAAHCCGPQIAPGHVLIVPIANFKNRNAVNPLQPKTSRRTLLEMEAFLQAITSPFVKVHAKNPVYEQILTTFCVQFIEGADKGYYLKQLNEDIVQFLTPWLFDENAVVNFGQKIYASAIVNFIEERSYVDFITEFAMYVCKHECCPSLPEKKENIDLQAALDKVHGCADVELLFQESDGFGGEVIAKPSTPRSILVSVPQHIIVPYEAPIYISPCQKRQTTNVTVIDSARHEKLATKEEEQVIEKQRETVAKLKKATRK